MSDQPTQDFIHKEFPKQFARDDFWAQIKRTVNGRPVSEQEIELIVAQIKRHLQLTPQTHLLDLGCGNGALAARLFSDLGRYTGVDFSAYLLGVAQEYFRPSTRIEYVESDARHFVADHEPTSTFDKALVYGCMSYFTRAELAAMLDALHRRFSRLDTVFLGNIPDRNHAAEFFSLRKVVNYELDQPQSPIGIWWDPSDVTTLGVKLGYTVEIAKMPPAFYGHHYRFDAILRRAQSRRTDAGAIET